MSKIIIGLTIGFLFGYLMISFAGDIGWRFIPTTNNGNGCPTVEWVTGAIDATLDNGTRKIVDLGFCSSGLVIWRVPGN